MYGDNSRAAAAGQAPARVAPFPPLSARLSSFSSLAPLVEYSADTMLFQQGFQVCTVYVIERGLVKLTALDEDGNGLIIGLRSADAILGGAAAIAHKPHPVTAVTLTQCQLRCVPLDSFLELTRSSNEFGWHLHELHSLEIHYLASQLIGLKYLSARQRLEQLIWQLTGTVEPNGSKRLKLHLPLKHWEMAQLVGITPEHLSRVLRDMQREGVLFKDKRALVIAQPARLHRP